jgi:hypothetical protein
LLLFEAGLAAWRLAHMLVHEAGPNAYFIKLREKTGIEYGQHGPISWPDWNPLHCVFCTSVYTAVAMLVVPAWLRRSLAIAAVAFMVESAFVEKEVE